MEQSVEENPIVHVSRSSRTRRFFFKVYAMDRGVVCATGKDPPTPRPTGSLYIMFMQHLHPKIGTTLYICLGIN